MLLWFVGTAVVTIWFVFGDPAFDYRLLVVGSVIPAPVDAAIDAAIGGTRVLHSVTFSVTLLLVLMLVTPGRRPIRRTLLGLPLGTMLHLVFTGAWLDAAVFWWPFLGWDVGDAAHPVASRGWWNLPLEVVGAVLCWWVVRRADLRSPERRTWFLRTGQLALPRR